MVLIVQFPDGNHRQDNSKQKKRKWECIWTKISLNIFKAQVFCHLLGEHWLYVSEMQIFWNANPSCSQIQALGAALVKEEVQLLS